MSLIRLQLLSSLGFHPQRATEVILVWNWEGIKCVSSEILWTTGRKMKIKGLCIYHTYICWASIYVESFLHLECASHFFLLDKHTGHGAGCMLHLNLMKKVFYSSKKWQAPVKHWVLSIFTFTWQKLSL